MGIQSSHAGGDGIQEGILTWVCSGTAVLRLSTGAGEWGCRDMINPIPTRYYPM